MRTAFADVPIGKIKPGRNVRFSVPEVEEMAQSLRLHGMLQPITIIPSEDPDFDFEVLFGHRRLAGAQKIQMETVPAFLKVRGEQKQRILTQVEENFARVDMTPIEIAHAIKDLQDEGMNARDIGAWMHRTEAWVYGKTRLLKFPEKIQMAVHEGTLTETDCANIPSDLLNDHETMEKLALAAPLGREHFRLTVANWMKQRNRKGSHGKRWVRRYFVEVSVDTNQVALAGCTADKITKEEWVTQAILEYSRKRKKDRRAMVEI